MPDTPLASAANRLHRLVLETHPFEATADGLPGYDGLAPDLSPDSAAALTSNLAALDAETQAATSEARRSLDATITLDTVRWTIDRETTRLRHGGIDHVVSTILAEGPAVVLTTASRTRPEDPEAAAAYLRRCAAFADYLDQHAACLTEGSRNGRRPVRALAEAALAQVDDYLADSRSDVVTGVPAPGGWSGSAAWRDEVGRVVERRVRPAFARWRTVVADLPMRPDEEAGLCHLDNGAADYQALIRSHTTLDLDPRDVHERGLELVASTSAELEDLGRTVGRGDLAEVVAGFAESSAAVTAVAAAAGFRTAVRRAERHLAALVTEPLPPACAVEAMPEHLGATGHAPHYTSPKLDGSRPGTFWFNAEEPGAGGGWDLEALAFHEAVPGHHLQVWRAQRDERLPDLQRHGFVPAHGEGWALYAEQLMGEHRLYSTVQAEMGALVLRLFRVARLVVDTGLHAYGWPIAEATAWLCRAVPVPPAFAAAEVRRYVAAPGQALSYAIGLQEILRLRDEARTALGQRYDERQFHERVLGFGAVPLTSVARAVDDWVGCPPQRATAAGARSGR